MCVGNSARSQIAEGLAKSMLGKGHNIQSAGSKPAQIVHKTAISIMQEIDIDISGYKTKSIESLEKDFINELDYAITLCAEEVCPAVPSATKIFHWPNEDPDNDDYNHQQEKNAFTKTRQNIFNLLKKFVIEEKIL